MTAHHAVKSGAKAVTGASEWMANATPSGKRSAGIVKTRGALAPTGDIDVRVAPIIQMVREQIDPDAHEISCV